MRTSQILAKLKDLMNKAGEFLHERVMLAAQAYADKHWIQEECSGDDWRAVEILSTHFADVCHGRLSFLNLMALAKRFPDIADWRKRKFNVIVMLDEMASDAAAKDKESRDPPKRATVKDLEKKEEVIKELTVKAATETKRSLQAESEVEKLRRRLAVVEQEKAELELENATLKGRLEELERVLEKQEVA